MALHAHSTPVTEMSGNESYTFLLFSNKHVVWTPVGALKGLSMLKIIAVKLLEVYILQFGQIWALFNMNFIADIPC